jgi:hypothetical protein
LWSQSSELNILHREYGQNVIIDNGKGGTIVPLSYHLYIYYQYRIKQSFQIAFLQQQQKSRCEYWIVTETTWFNLGPEAKPVENYCPKPLLYPNGEVKG